MIFNAKIILAAAPQPSVPVEGQFYYDSTMKKVLLWDGTKWI